MLMRYWGRKPTELIRELVDEASDVVIDPFGGSGSTVITASQTGRRSIYLDINPYAWLVAFVNSRGVNRDEFVDRGMEVLEMAKHYKTKKMTLKNDYLYYKNKPFFKKSNVERVSQLFSLENFRKLYSILISIDKIEATLNTRIGLYGVFCSSLFASSLMKRKNAGSWGVPSYWVPRDHVEEDPFDVFERTLKHFANRMKEIPVELNLDNAISFDYPSDSTLITDPPFFDEVQYMELSFFYWSWLRESKFPDILGKRRFLFSKELIYNPMRSPLDEYMRRFTLFLRKTKRIKRKYLIFHEDNLKLRDDIVKIVRGEWGSIEVREVTIENQRKIGPRGGKEYLIIKSFTA